MRRSRAMVIVLILVLCLGGGTLSCSDPKEPQDAQAIEAWRDVQYQLTDDTRHEDKVVTTATFDVDMNIAEAKSEVLSYNPVFNSGMVLQQGAVNVISGKTTAKNIAVYYKSTMYYGTVSESGDWSVYLPIMRATNTPYRMIAYTEAGKATLTNVYVGEVFMCAGQSNMDITLAQFAAFATIPGRPSNNHQADINNANDPLLRLFLADNTTASREPVDTYGSTALWQGATSATVGTFSAVGYLFGRRMREVLKVPVGLIDTAVGGTALVYWLSGDGYAELVQEGISLGADTRDPDDSSVTESNPINASLVPAFGYNGIINPLRHLKIRGTVWYQGESDAMIGISAAHYEKGLHKLAKVWRETFDSPNMFWTIIELPRWDGASLLNGPSAFARIRSAQQNFAKTDKLGALSIGVDLGEWTTAEEDDSIHPNDKSEISLRAANESLYRFFGSAQNRSPILHSYAKNGNSVTLTFDNAGAGLSLKNAAKGFEISSDGVMFSENSGATATVSQDGRSITVNFSTAFKAIRYAVDPVVNYDLMVDVSKQVTIFNSFGLPVDQFEIKFE